MFEREGRNKSEGSFPPNRLKWKKIKDVPLLWQPRTNHATGGNTELTF